MKDIRTKSNFVVIAIGCLFAIFVLNLSAQTPVEAPDAPIKVETVLINIPLVVSDREGRHIGGLTKDDFSILLDGEKQSIDYFADSEAPLSVAIIVDMSGSTIPVIKEIREAAKAFVEQLNPADQAVVLTFDQSTTIDVVCKLTSDKKRLSGKIGSLYHHFSGLRNGRDPAITPDMYDTIYRAITKEFVGVKGRKAMIVLTDGFIHGQTVSPRVFDDMIVEGDTVIYPMMFLTSEHMGRRTDGITYEELYKLPVTMALNSIAIKTGGRLLISAKGTDFKTAFANVADELRKQYVIGFYPSNTDKHGSGRIAISINRPDAKFRTKASIRVKPVADPK